MQAMQISRLFSLLAAVLLCACGASDAEALGTLGTLGTLEVFVDPNEATFPMDGGLAEGQLALTFDDGPDPITTRRILSILRNHGVLATFFQVGVHVESYPELTPEILSDGHSVGSHTWDHPDLATLPLDVALENIQRGVAAVERASAVGFHNPFFRFPFFSSTAELRAAVHEAGLVPFHANIVTEDWSTPDPGELLVKALAEVEAQKRGVVLFHDIQPQTADMLDAFLTEIRARGYRTVVFRPAPTLASLAAAHDSRCR